jgi:hypothetical protein
MQDSILKYYSFKNAAELAILDSNYTTANNDYKNAFKYKCPNLLDMYNAFVVAALAAYSDQAKFVFSDLVLHDMANHQFEKMTFPTSIAGTPFYQWSTLSFCS